MGKTDTIKERRVDVYLDTFDRKERWTQYAEEAGESLSKFVQKAVEYTMQQGGLDYEELGERSEKIHALEEEIRSLRKDISQKDIVIEKLEADLEQHQVRPFLDESYEGTRRYNRELVEILQEGGLKPTEELLRRLDVRPTETDRMQAIDRQLEQLEVYGLVTHTANGWRWTA